MLDCGFNRAQNNISHPHIGIWHFTDIYMPISEHVRSTTSFLRTHSLSIH